MNFVPSPETSAEDRAKGYVRPYSDKIVHSACETRTGLFDGQARMFALKPDLYSVLFCAHCNSSFPVSEFLWIDTDGNQKGEVGQ